jgi:protein-disulfide isomerase
MHFRHLSFIGLALVLMVSTWSAYSASNPEDSETETLSFEQKFRKIEAEIATLRQQFLILNKNQQAIAAHTGLKPTGKEATKKQPTLEIGNSASIGDEKSSVVLIEFTDLHCPFCQKFHLETFDQLNEKYIKTNKLLFVGKHFPITALHKNSFVASKALECAREQETAQNHYYKNSKTWLFKEGAKFSTQKFTDDLALDKKTFNSCIKSAKVEQQINDDMDLAKSIGITQTPSFLFGIHKNGKIVDWKIIIGAKTFKQFSKVIDRFIDLSKAKD